MDGNDDDAPSVAPMRHERAASSVSCAASEPADSLLPSWCHVSDKGDDNAEDPLAINCSGAVHEKIKSGRPANRAISLSSARWFSPCKATLACKDEADEAVCVVANAA